MPHQAWLLVLAALAVGVLHTMVPDHWAPIALLARQHGWSSRQTARTAALAGVGHTGSTLIIAAIVWLAGSVAALRFGHAVSLLSSIALIAFGAWIAVGGWREARSAQTPGDAVRSHSQRTALLLILGSSPMVEGIPAFFAAGRYGAGVLGVMAAVFAAATIGTYVICCVASARGLRSMRLGHFERYGEVMSGAVVAVLGAVFLIWPLA